MGRGHSNGALNLGESVDSSPVYSYNDTHWFTSRMAFEARASLWPNHGQTIPLAKCDYHLGPPLCDCRVIKFSCHTHWRLTNRVWILRQNKQQKASSSYAKKAAATQLQLRIESSSCTACARELLASQGDALYLPAISKPA